MLAIQRKKRLEDVLHKRMGAQDNLEQFLMTLSDAEGSKKVLEAMKYMSEQMRNIGVNADEGECAANWFLFSSVLSLRFAVLVDDTLIAVREYMDDAKDVSRALAEPLDQGDAVDGESISKNKH